ncbi:MAG: hypothetical protein ACTSQA_02110 [Candidatus Heimdallarchaeaceae archaeon]
MENSYTKWLEYQEMEGEDWTIDDEGIVVMADEDLHSRQDGYLWFPTKDKATEYLKSVTKNK